MKLLFSVLIFLALFSLNTHAQNSFCRMTGSANSTQSSNCTASCNTYDDYLPLPDDSIIYIRLNFHYLKMAVTPGKFDNATLAEAQATVADVNYIFDSLWQAQIPYGAPYIKRTRIRFVLNSFLKEVDSLAYWSAGSGNWSAVSNYIADPNAIDIVFKSDDGSDTDSPGYGVAQGFGAKAIKFHDFELSSGYLWWYYTNTLVHELGHCLGLFHTNQLSASPCITDINLSQEIATWGHTGVCNTSLSSTVTNNIMGYNFGCSKYLSPDQLEVCHYIIRNLPIVFNTLTPASQSYVRRAHNITTWSSPPTKPGYMIVI